MAYAEDTTVPVERSRAELEKTLARYGAVEFGYATKPGLAMVQFTLADRHVRFVVALPGPDDHQLTPTGLRRTEAQARTEAEKAVRARWRALNLVVKAKLEAAETGISTIEEEFLAHTVMPDGSTVWEATKDAIAAAYRLGTVQPLLALPASR